MSVDRASVPPDFTEDKRRGRVGEQFTLNSILKKYSENGYDVYDVREVPFWEEIDIDFVVTKKGNVLTNDWECVRSDKFLKIEVKVDGKAIESGNLAYEIISHGKFGWALKTHADRVFMFITDKVISKNDKGEDSLHAYEWYIIDMKKWKAYADYVSNSPFGPNWIRDEIIVDILHRISDLKKENIILKEFSLNCMI